MVVGWLWFIPIPILLWLLLYCNYYRTVRLSLRETSLLSSEQRSFDYPTFPYPTGLRIWFFITKAFFLFFLFVDSEFFWQEIWKNKWSFHTSSFLFYTLVIYFILGVVSALSSLLVKVLPFLWGTCKRTIVYSTWALTFSSGRTYCGQRYKAAIMDLLMLSIIVISILAGLILGLYYLVVREYCMNAEIDKASPVEPVVEITVSWLRAVCTWLSSKMGGTKWVQLEISGRKPFCDVFLLPENSYECCSFSIYTVHLH